MTRRYPAFGQRQAGRAAMAPLFEGKVAIISGGAHSTALPRPAPSAGRDHVATQRDRADQILRADLGHFLCSL
jgi:hypothetical protein